MGPSVQGSGSGWWQRPNQTTGRPTSTTGHGWVPPPTAAPVPTTPAPTPTPYTPVGRSPGNPMDPMDPINASGNMSSPQSGLLGMLFNPAEHGNLAYAGMANAGNKGLDYTSASSRGMTDQILGQPIPVGGYGIGTGLPGGGLGTPVDVRAARLAATPDADQLAQVQNTSPDDFWNTIMQATRR